MPVPLCIDKGLLRLSAHPALQPVFLLGVQIPPGIVRVDDQIPAIAIGGQARLDLDQLRGRPGLDRLGS
jgi:hypothetical protein